MQRRAALLCLGILSAFLALTLTVPQAMAAPPEPAPTPKVNSGVSVRSADGCVTTGGADLVLDPSFANGLIDRRIANDVEFFVRRYRVLIVEGYAIKGHNPVGEHPLGLAVDIVPDRRRGGNWDDVARLARYLEPRPNRPRASFRFIGYTGDRNFGRGSHLHVSWQHSPAAFNTRAEQVSSLLCPDPDQLDVDDGVRAPN